jgi:hypothetical protein
MKAPKAERGLPLVIKSARYEVLVGYSKCQRRAWSGIACREVFTTHFAHVYFEVRFNPPWNISAGLISPCFIITSIALNSLRLPLGTFASVPAAYPILAQVPIWYL